MSTCSSRSIAGTTTRVSAGTAFIHTLAFGGGVWCLEVPVEMELSERAGALAIAPGR
jgi:hypothetical protein